MTKVKELLNIRINEHSKHILSVPWRDLSHENVPYGLPFSNGFGIRSKKLSSIRASWAICSEKLVIRLNGLGYLFEI